MGWGFGLGWELSWLAVGWAGFKFSLCLRFPSSFSSSLSCLPSFALDHSAGRRTIHKEEDKGVKGRESESENGRGRTRAREVKTETKSQSKRQR